MGVRHGYTKVTGIRLLWSLRNRWRVAIPRRRLPEEKLIDIAFRAALMYKVISCLGKLALIWATVVLLGGFSTLIKSEDFWVVTSIVFVEAMRIFSTPEEHDEQFFIRAPDAMRIIRVPETQDSEPPPKCTFFPCRFFFASIFPTAFMLVQVAVVTISVALSLWRLIKQDYVDSPPACKDPCKDDHKNIKVSLNIFYGMVVAQGIAFFANLANPMVKQMCDVCREYKLDRSLGMPLLTRYMLDNYMKCVTGNVLDAFRNDLVTYAKELVSSDLAEDQRMGVWTLDLLLKSSKYRGRFLIKLRASGDTIGKIVYMLGSKSPEEEEDTTVHAAEVLLELAPYILVESFPGMLQLVSSLLIPNITKQAASGLQILGKLMDNADNCRHVAHSASYFLSMIIDLTNCADEKIVEASVSVLHKLASSAGEVGDALRCSIFKNVHILSSITNILEHCTSKPKLQVEAVGVLACLALDKTGREDICTSHRVIRALLTLLLKVAEIQEDGPDRARLAKGAAEALVLLTGGSRGQDNMVSILVQIKPECIQQFGSVISREEGEHRYLIAKLLWNLLAHPNANQYAHHFKKIDSTLPEIMKAINLGVETLKGTEHLGADDAADITKQGKLLESLVGLVVQICTFAGATNHFADALRSANLEASSFVQKLKKILVLYKSPTTEFPGIRRVAIQLIIWMMRNNKSYIKEFVQYGVDKALNEVAYTATKLESFELFYCGVGVCKHSEPVSSLVSVALALMAPDVEIDTKNRV